jgi:hypothetical protein
MQTRSIVAGALALGIVLAATAHVYPVQAQEDSDGAGTNGGPNSSGGDIGTDSGPVILPPPSLGDEIPPPADPPPPPPPNRDDPNL